MIDYLDAINTWYQSKCDGLWEQGYGFSLDNIDNPGWCIKITGENNKEIYNLRINLDDDDTWLSVNASEHSFTGYCGVLALNELLAVAVKWLELP